MDFNLHNAALGCSVKPPPINTVMIMDNKMINRFSDEMEYRRTGKDIQGTTVEKWISNL